MVHQHFMLVDDMTVAENVALGLRGGRHPLIDLDHVAERVTRLSADYGLSVDPSARIEDLSVGMRQRVEILKLLYRRVRILILDEPTAVLTPQEAADLLAVFRSLVAHGRAVVFITHKLDEVTGVAQRCTVLRDGAVVATVQLGDVDKPALARMMVGRDVVLRTPRVAIQPGAPVLEVRGLSHADPQLGQRLDDVNLQVRAGEIVGIAGVDGNGQHELLRCLMGQPPADHGEIRLLGEPVAGVYAAATAARDVAVIPADRQREGLALGLSLRDNLIMRDVRALSSHGVLRVRAIRDHCQRLVRDYDIRTRDIGVRMAQLSGGNQQKAVIARELHRGPRLVIAAQPTRGLDVGAMEYVYRRLLEHKAGGGATLLLSTDLEEILSLADRVAVISQGRIAATMSVEDADPQTLGLLMAGEAA
jgi:simple sugar transport system ATP-binding protein